MKSENILTSVVLSVAMLCVSPVVADQSDALLRSITRSADFGYVPDGSYIDTGISPDENTRVEMLVWVGGPAENWFGCWDTDRNHGAFCMGNDITGVYTAAGDSSGTAAFGDVGTIPAGIHLLAASNGVFTCDGAVIASRPGSFALAQTLYLFAQNRKGAAASRNAVGGIWCKYARIYSGSTLVKDYQAEVSSGKSLFREKLSGAIALASVERKRVALHEYLKVQPGAYANTAYPNGMNDADLGIFPTANTVVETRLTYASSLVFEVFGAWNYPQTTTGAYKLGNFGLAVDKTTTTYVGWGVGATSKSYSTVPTAGEKVFHLGPDFGGWISTDYATTNAALSDFTGQTFDSAITQPLYLCAQNRGGSVHPGNFGTVNRWTWFKVWENGRLIRYFVPASFNSVAGYFDVLKGGFYPSRGNVAFTAGPELVDESELVVDPPEISAAEVSATVSFRVVAPNPTTVRLRLSANGRTRELPVREVSSSETLVFNLEGLSPAAEYATTLIAEDDTGAAVTNQAAFVTAALPKGKFVGLYQLIDCVRFNGKQCLSTGIVPSDHRVEVSYETTTYVSDAHILGNMTATGNFKWLNWTEYTPKGTSSKVYFIGHHGDGGNDWGTWSSGRHTLVLNDKQAGVYTHTFDGEVVESGADKLASAEGPLYLNYRGEGPSYEGYMNFCGKVYALILTDNANGEKVADYLPAKDSSSGRVGFYDTVTKAFKPATYGELLAGSAVGGSMAVGDPVFGNGAFSASVSVSRVGGTLKCYYGTAFAGADAAAWDGSVAIGEVDAGGTSLTAQVPVPDGAKYVRLAVDSGDGIEWFDAFALEWLDDGQMVLPIPDTEALLSSYVHRFNQGDNENLPATPSFIRNADAQLFLLANAPRFACPDKDIERTYYFRWWTFRKHIRHDSDYYTVSEFLGNVAWAGAGNTIVCPAGHHFREGRWLRDPKYITSLARFWLSSSSATHRRNYVAWLYTGACELAEVTGDATLVADLLDDAIANYAKWEEGFTWNDHGSGNYEPMGGDGEGGFLSTCDREGTEYALSGNGYRPMVNSAMWSEAHRISEVARKLGRGDVAALYAAKADATLAALTNRCWSPSLGFFTVQHKDKSTRGDVRELHGYAPWYFGVPVEGCPADWSQLTDPQGFAAQYGLSFPERRAEGFAIEYTSPACKWNGPSWPYATTVALTALANELHAGRAQGQAESYRQLLRQYAVQHRLTYDPGVPESAIVPWIDENFDQDNFVWLARRIFNAPTVERGKDYNHSAFCDLVISGLMGVVPNGPGSVIVDPLAPASWRYFALENVRYHGHDLSIRFQRGGEGYRVLLDGRCVFSAAEPQRTVVRFKEPDPFRCVKLLKGRVSATLVGGMLTVRVAPGAVDKQAVVSLVWDEVDHGAVAADWPHAAQLGLSVGPAGGEKTLVAADLGIPDGVCCRVVLGSGGYTKTAYVGATGGGQRIDLGIAATEVYEFDFGFALNEVSGASRWNAVFAGTASDFAIGTIATTHRQIFLRHHKDEAWSNKPATDLLAANQMTDMTVSNRAVLKDGEFLVNGTKVCTTDTTQGVGTIGSNLYLFNYADYSDMRICNARCYYLKLYGANGELLRDFVAALDGAGVPCLYDRQTGVFCHVDRGAGALAYDPSTNEVFPGISSLTRGFKFYNDSARAPNDAGLIFFVR